MAKIKNPRGRKETTEHFTKLLRTTMQTDAWRALSPKAQALYPWFKLEWHGPRMNNNGAIRFSVRQAAQALGVRSNDTAASAIHELQAKGFLVVRELARLGTSGAARSTAFEITELSMPHSENASGRKLYLEWAPNNDFPIQKMSANNPLGRNGKQNPVPNIMIDSHDK